jgi:hypothetical protein
MAQDTALFTISGSTYGVVVARDLNGNQVASAFNGREGWAVTNRRGPYMHQICCETEAEALSLLNVVAELVTA